MPRKRASKKPQKSTTVEEPLPSDVGLQADSSGRPSEALVTAPIESLSESVVVSNEEVPGFAEKHAPKRDAGDQSQNFGIAGDYEAGVRLIENRRDQLMTLKFEQKPHNDVLVKLRDAGFRWHPSDEVWNRSIHPESARKIRIEAEKVFEDVRQMIRTERELGEGSQVTL